MLYFRQAAQAVHRLRHLSWSGNATGFIVMEPTLAGKWLELLKAIAPRVTRVAFYGNQNT